MADPHTPPLTLYPHHRRYPVVRLRTFVAMQRLLLVLITVLLAWPSYGQRLMSRKRPDIIPLGGEAKRIGWYIGPGLTYTLAPKNAEHEVFRSGDTLSVGNYRYAGQIGPYIEAGIAWFTRDPVVVDYFDLGMAYKAWRGRMEVDGLTTIAGQPVMDVIGEGEYSEQMLSFHFNANKFIQVRDYQFFQLSLGVNADLDVFGDGGGTSLEGDFVGAQPFVGSEALGPYTRRDNDPYTEFRTALHFKLGYGFKVTGNLLIIPAIETPIFNVVPEDQGFGQLQWFSSRYRPLIFSVRFLFLRARDGFDCPPPVREPGQKKGQHKHYKPATYHP